MAVSSHFIILSVLSMMMSSKELLFSNETPDLIQHISIPELVDGGNAVFHDRCSIDFFHHNETYTEDDDTNNDQHTYSPNDAYFFVSWTTINDRGNTQIVGNIYNVKSPYLPIGDYNDSLPITPYNDDRNYHFVSTSDFRSKPDDIIFSFYNENNIEIHVFGSTKSHFYDDTFLWSPKIPIIGKKNNASSYNIIHENIQCIDGSNEEFIIFVYEEKYILNNIQYTNIYKSTFNNKYVVSHDNNRINTIQGIITHPMVSQSFTSSNIIITYIVNHISIQHKVYLIDNMDKLTPLHDAESVIVSVENAENTENTMKYYNIIPLSIGGYIIMYSIKTNQNQINGDKIYIVLIDDDGNRLNGNDNIFGGDIGNDIFIEYESNNTLSHGAIIELNDDTLSNSETYVLLTFVNVANDNKDKLNGKVYKINIDNNTPSDVIEEIGNAEMNSFPNGDDFDVHPYFECINYDKQSKMFVVGWLNNYHQFAYKPFKFNPPSNTNNNNNNNDIISTISPSITTTSTSTSNEENEINSTNIDGEIDDNNSAELVSNNASNGLSSDMEIVVIVLCTAGFFCCIIGLITCFIIYMVNTGKLRFAIGYKQIQHQKRKKRSNGNDEEDDDDDEDDEDLELGDDDKSGFAADDEQTVDEDGNNNNNINKQQKRIKKNKKNNDAKSRMEMHQLVDESD